MGHWNEYQFVGIAWLSGRVSIIGLVVLGRVWLLIIIRIW